MTAKERRSTTRMWKIRSTTAARTVSGIRRRVERTRPCRESPYGGEVRTSASLPTEVRTGKADDVTGIALDDGGVTRSVLADGLDKRRPAPAHRVDDQVVRLRVVHNGVLGDCRQHLAGVGHGLR
jgi:hypothetical protein